MVTQAEIDEIWVKRKDKDAQFNRIGLTIIYGQLEGISHILKCINSTHIPHTESGYAIREKIAVIANEVIELRNDLMPQVLGHNQPTHQ